MASIGNEENALDVSLRHAHRRALQNGSRENRNTSIRCRQPRNGYDVRVRRPLPGAKEIENLRICRVSQVLDWDQRTTDWRYDEAYSASVSNAIYGVVLRPTTHPRDAGGYQLE